MLGWKQVGGLQRGLVRRPRTPNHRLPFQWQKAKCVTHCAPGDAGAQALVSACRVRTTAEVVSA